VNNPSSTGLGKIPGGGGLDERKGGFPMYRQSRFYLIKESSQDRFKLIIMFGIPDNIELYHR